MPNMGSCVSAASRNRLSPCATHGAGYLRSGHSLLGAHGPRVEMAGKTGFWGLSTDFWVSSSYVASLKHACRDKMQAVFPGPHGELKHVRPMPISSYRLILRELLAAPLFLLRHGFRPDHSLEPIIVEWPNLRLGGPQRSFRPYGQMTLSKISQSVPDCGNHMPCVPPWRAY
jgi:hypothetical protein